MPDFQTILTAAGLQPTRIVADGRWYRCRTDDKPRRRNGAYLLDITGRHGVFKNYATDLDWNVWSLDGPVTLAQVHDDMARRLQYRAQELQDRKAAINAARAYFAQLPPMLSGHPYIDAKGLSRVGLKGVRRDGDLMVVPVTRNGQIQSLQTIDPSGQKRYRTGCPIKGGVFLMDRPNVALTCFVEGFATGLAVFQALSQCRVVVCFDAGNLIEVAKHFQGEGLGVVCADNDHATEARMGANKGLEAGQKAAELMGCGLAYPKGLEGSDWADAMAEFGPDALRWIARKINHQSKPFRKG